VVTIQTDGGVVDHALDQTLLVGVMAAKVVVVTVAVVMVVVVDVVAEVRRETDDVTSRIWIGPSTIRRQYCFI